MHFPWSAANENSSWKTIESRAQKVKAAAFEILFLLSPHPPLCLYLSRFLCNCWPKNVYFLLPRPVPAIAVLAQFDDLTILWFDFSIFLVFHIMRHDNNASNGSGNNNDGNDEDYKANDHIRAAGAPISSFDHCASSGASSDTSKRNFRQLLQIREIPCSRSCWGCAIIIIECCLNRFLVSINNGVDLGISVSVTTQISVIIEAIDCKLCMKVSVYHTPIKSIYNCRRHAQLPRKSIISFLLWHTPWQKGYDSPSVHLLYMWIRWLWEKLNVDPSPSSTTTYLCGPPTKAGRSGSDHTGRVWNNALRCLGNAYKSYEGIWEMYEALRHPDRRTGGQADTSNAGWGKLND